MAAQGTPNIIIGTAGHVDHGKTALVERLTGINADRFAEEQERGLTIDLGFAWMRLPGGAWAGIVDVPGHERFVKNMLAGATGIDVFLLVVAADEGVMPQTREHLTILNVLDIGAGIVVLTKSDLMEPELLDLVREEVAEALQGTVFEGAPSVAVSARTGEGIEALVGLLDEAARAARPRDVTGPVRVQLDRSFTLKGHGTVVTGSLTRGRLRVDDELEITPSGRRTRVRSIEVYGEHLDEVAAPCRVGVNLAGLSKDEVERGDQLIAPGSMTPAWMLDVRLRLAPDARRPLLDRERVRIHHGAAEILGRVVLLDAEALGPGEEGLAQLRLEAPAVAAAGDRFVIRRYSPAYAIGGGAVLDPTPRRHRRREVEAVDRLRALESGGETDRARDWLRARGLGAAGASELAAGLQVDPEEAARWLDELETSGQAAAVSAGRFVDAEQADGLLDSVQRALAAFHAEAPLRAAMPLNRLQAALGQPAPEVLQWALATLRQGGQVVAETEGLRLAEHRVALSEAQEKALAQAEAQALKAGPALVGRADVLAALNAAGEAQVLLQVSLGRGALLPVGEFLIHRQALATAARQLAERYAAQGAFGVGEVRDLWGTSRKTVVPLLEFLDGVGFTRREGDRRHVTRAPGPREGVEG